VLANTGDPSPPSASVPKTDDPVSMYLNDVFTVTVNLAGCRDFGSAGLTHDGLPLGLQIIGKAFDEATVLRGGPRHRARRPISKPLRKRGGEADERTACEARALIEGAPVRWEVVIGMEVHAQVASKAKLFSGAATEFGGEPNRRSASSMPAMPGMLPVINGYCVEQAVARAWPEGQDQSCLRVRPEELFLSRSAAGYQISQYKQPSWARGGLIDLANGETVRVRHRTAASGAGRRQELHDQHPDYTYVDLNRAGVALMEDRQPPDMRSSEEAAAFCASCARSCAISAPATATWRAGSMRADVNVSVRKPGARSARAARSRTSTPCASSCRP
jgi:hypothetical protein